MNKLRQLIRESINEYIRDIDESGNVAALEAKMGKTKEAIELREKKMNMDGLDEAYHDMLDKGKVKELSNEVKALKKSLAKYEKQLEKLNKKGEKIAKVEDTEEKEIVDEVAIDEVEVEEAEDMEIYEILYMQKLAGIISESEYVVKIEEAKKKKASADMTKKAKSAVVTKARAGKDIGKKGKGFEDVAKAAGGGEKGKKIAAAAMWKDEAKKAKSLKEEIEALFENEILNEENEFNAASYFSSMDSKDPHPKAFIQNIKKVADSDLSKRSTIINKLKDHAKTNPEVKGKLDAAIEFINS
jgi:hypothetical protein